MTILGGTTFCELQNCLVKIKTRQIWKLSQVTIAYHLALNSTVPEKGYAPIIILHLTLKFPGPRVERKLQCQ